MLVSHVQSAVHLPINADGFLESLRGNGKAWTINLDHFEGGSTPLGSVDSFCSPQLDFRFVARVPGHHLRFRRRSPRGGHDDRRPAAVGERRAQVRWYGHA